MTMEDCAQELRAFLNEKGQLTSMPSKHRKKLLVYYYIGTKVEPGRRYTESELNDLIDEWGLFHDAATVRREMYNFGLLNRERDGSVYWKETDIPPMEAFVASHI